MPVVLRSLTAATAAAALVAPALVGLSPAVAAAEVVLRDVREFSCPPGQVPDGGFTDADVLEVDCLVAYGVTEGKTTTTYAPTETVSRAQMALFLSRIADRAGLELDTTDAGFTDLGTVSPAARDAINAVANLGVAQGVTATTYDPSGTVGRGQMASFIVRLQGQVGEAFTSSEDYFTDDAAPHEENIDALAAAGVVQGTGGGLYGPADPVSRQQMALFLTRYLDTQVEAGTIDPFYEVRTNQVLDVEPEERSTVAVGGERPFVASGLEPGVEHRITVVRSSTVRTGADGTLRFTDSDGDRLAEVGTYDARLTDVNGQAVAAPADGAPSTATATPGSNGQLTFRIGGGQEGDDVVAVVYTNQGRSPRLELAADLRPVEVFGVSGRTIFQPPAAPAADDAPDGVVTARDLTASKITVDTDDEPDGRGDVVYTYDDGDEFKVEGTLVTQDQFEAALTRGDTLVVGRYFATEAGTSAFDIGENTPTAPESVTAEEGEPQGTVVVTVVPGTPDELALYDAFVIERAPVSTLSCGSPAGRPGTYTTLATATADADTQADGFQYVDREVAEGCYVYRASGVVDGERGDAATSNQVESAGPPDLSGADRQRPVATDARVQRDFGSEGRADTGDQWVIVFDEDLGPVPSDALIQVRPEGGTTTVTVRNGEDARFSASGDRLTVDLFVLGVNLGDYPLEITGQAGITDTSGNTWSVGLSPDKLIDEDDTTP